MPTLKDGILQDDTYSVFVPIKDHDLMKSIEIDENGDYIIKGVMTSDAKDEEDDSITPEGMDCSYFLDKGWIKYEHGNNPNQFIGEPLEVKVGQFEHPTLKTLVKGIYVKGRLFAQRKLAQDAIQAMQDLQKSHTKRTMGWSIEGNVKQRDRSSGKIIKSVLRNVVLTMNPINTMTWAELAKSFAKNHELTIDMPVEKSMDIETAQAIMPQSLEGAHTKKEDPQDKWIKLFRSFCRGNFLEKSLRNKFVTSTEGAVGMTAYTYALADGLDNDEAYQFASYIADRHKILKSLFSTNLGGERMGKLASLLDTDLEELRKSLELEEEEDDDEELEKSVKDTKDKKKKKDEEEDEDKEDDEEDEDKEEDDEDKEDEEDHSFKKKSLQTDFAKSFGANPENGQALEVSDFLLNLTEEVGYSMDGFEKSMSHVVKQNTAITSALVSFGELVKGLAGTIETLQTENGELKKSFEDLLNKPVGRKGVVTTREAVTLQKSMETGLGEPLTRGKIGDVLMKSFEAGEIPGNSIARFEAGVSLGQLNLPASVKAKLGL